MSGLQINSGAAPVLYIGSIPGRKREAICFITNGNVYEPIAYLKNEKEARKFKRLVADLVSNSD